MTTKVNGKTFDFKDIKKPNTLFSNERPDNEGSKLLNYALIGVICFTGYELLPWVVKGIELFFRPFMNALGIPY